MTQQNAPPPAARRPGLGWRVFGLLGLAAMVGGLVYDGLARDVPAPPPPPPDKQPTLGGIPLFSDWPKDRKPDAVLVLSGQTFGFVQPCGCSRPQMGGLERRANFMDSLRAKGWPVVGVDLGDVYPAKGAVAEQQLMKYATGMHALREMGYVAVGVGKTEFGAGLHRVVAEYALQKERPPYTLAGNVVGLVDGNPLPRDAFFPPAPGGTRPAVGLAEVVEVGGVAVGVLGLVGPSVAKDAEKADPLLGFEGNNKVLKTATDALADHPKKPLLNVLLYQGTVEEAKKLAADWPQFRVILCQADDPEPPQFPDTVTHKDGTKTLVIQVGHKGRYVGAVGVFKKDTGCDLKYQLVPLGEEYLTPNDPAAEKASKVLGLLEEYARQVKDRNMLAKVPRLPHPAQLQFPKLNLSYVGSEKCMGCHAAEYAAWKGSKHSHALEALETAKRPGLRNFDGECVVCHTVGFGYKTGYESEEKTPALKHVGCESCHGPGSGHMSAPKNADLLKLMSPWKHEAGDRLPDVATMEKVAKLNPVERGQVALPPAQLRVMNAVSQTCAKCHDAENDPHFDLLTYWPKVAHGGPAAAPAPKK